MTQTLNRHIKIKRYARLTLALFVLSILNMAAQMPAHAAMQQSMQLQKMYDLMPLMTESEMQDCKCPPALCETIDTLGELGIENQISITFKHLLGFQVIYFSSIDDTHQQPSALRLNRHEWQYRQVSPPPLSISSILHI